MSRLTLLLALIVASLLVSQTALAGSENTAREEAKSTAERQARAEIESLLSRLCPGRCELVALDVTVEEPRELGAVNPGFGGAAGARFETEVSRIEATVLMDSNLPETFRANLPRMAQFRLQDLAPDVEVRPEMLAFPDPQLPPMPDAPPEPPPQPRPLPEQPEEPAEEPAAEPPPEEATPPPAAPTAEAPLWQQALPWVALLLTLLILGGLIVLVLRRLEALSTARPDADRPAADGDTDAATSATMPDVEALRRELQRSRSALNRMLRRWIDDAPEEVAALVRLLGPEILSDLRRDPEFRPALQTVSDHVADFDDRLDAERAQSIAEKARSRFDAQLVVDDGADDAEWDFLEGLTLGQITTLLESASRREKSFLLTRLSSILRSRYLEQLDSDTRRQLLLDASTAEALSRTESRELAARLRQMADEFIDAGREATGQAAMIVEMIDAMALAEQEDVLGDLRDNRPDVAQRVLSRICLESALVELPSEVLADAIHRQPVETLATFLQGTRDDIRNYVLDASPASKRQAVATELSLDIPTTHADFLDARQAFSDALLSTLRRNGYDIAEFNTDALRRTAARRSSPTEVAP